RVGLRGRQRPILASASREDRLEAPGRGIEAEKDSVASREEEGRHAPRVGLRVAPAQARGDGNEVAADRAKRPGLQVPDRTIPPCAPRRLGAGGDREGPFHRLPADPQDSGATRFVEPFWAAGPGGEGGAPRSSRRLAPRGPSVGDGRARGGPPRRAGRRRPPPPPRPAALRAA